MNVTIACLSCGRENRIPTPRVGENPKCGTCGAPFVNGVPIDVSRDVLKKAARLDTMSLVVDFWAGWCGPCRAMAPEFAKTARAMKGDCKRYETLCAAGGDYPEFCALTW